MPGGDFLGDAWQEVLLDVTSLGFSVCYCMRARAVFILLLSS
jgi:hypothetical protein